MKKITSGVVDVSVSGGRPVDVVSPVDAPHKGNSFKR